MGISSRRRVRIKVVLMSLVVLLILSAKRYDDQPSCGQGKAALAYVVLMLVGVPRFLPMIGRFAVALTVPSCT